MLHTVLVKFLIRIVLVRVPYDDPKFDMIIMFKLVIPTCLFFSFWSYEILILNCLDTGLPCRRSAKKECLELLIHLMRMMTTRTIST